MGLKAEDPLCYGLKGYPIQNKQLNRITDAISNHLGWIEDKKVTPHGYRYAIATLLDERGIPRDLIKYLLGHKEKENIKYYIKRDRRKIAELRKALTEIETELETSLELNEQSPVSGAEEEGQVTQRASGETTVQIGNQTFSEDFILRLASAIPELAEKLLFQQEMQPTV